MNVYRAEARERRVSFAESLNSGGMNAIAFFHPRHQTPQHLQMSFSIAASAKQTNGNGLAVNKSKNCPAKKTCLVGVVLWVIFPLDDLSWLLIAERDETLKQRQAATNSIALL
jgi:hypothetical protein